MAAGARLCAECAAPAEVVYDLLADIRSHIDWGGARQRRSFRLLSIEAPCGPAAVGATFSSTGAIPMSMRRWEDRSTVSVADRAATFEFVTDARAVRGGRASLARYRHRYEIEPAGQGSRVTYTLTQLALVDPMLRLALPGVRYLTWRWAIPMFGGRGFRALLAQAEERAGTGVPTSHPGTPPEVSPELSSALPGDRA